MHLGLGALDDDRRKVGNCGRRLTHSGPFRDVSDPAAKAGGYEMFRTPSPLRKVLDQQIRRCIDEDW